jgi:hypothetical protein
VKNVFETDACVDFESVWYHFVEGAHAIEELRDGFFAAHVLQLRVREERCGERIAD